MKTNFYKQHPVTRLFLIVSAFLLGSCTKTSTTYSESLPGVGYGSKSSTATIITTTMGSSRSLMAGQTFIFQVTVKKGGSPAGNINVGVDDPLRSICVTLRTNSAGYAEYRSQIPPGEKAGLYQYRFYTSGAANILSSVSVTSNSGKVYTKAKVTLCSEDENNADAQTMFYSRRTNTSSGAVKAADVERYVSTFGSELSTELVNNRLLMGSLAVASVSCPLAITGAPAAVCAVSVTLASKQVAPSLVKAVLKTMIQASTKETQQTKNIYKNAVDVGSAVYAVAGARWNEGIVGIIENLNASWEFSDVVVKPIMTNGKVQALSVGGIVKSGPYKGMMCNITYASR